MFAQNDRIVYGMHGVCQIVDVETKRIGGKYTEYYVLQPLDQPGSRYYVPTQNENALAKMRPVLTQQELTELLQSSQVRDDAWVGDETQRKHLYSSLITGGDRAALLQMVHAIYKRKEALADSGRRLHLCDENFLRDAKRLLDSEISLVMEIPHEEVGNFVKIILDTP